MDRGIHWVLIIIQSKWRTFPPPAPPFVLIGIYFFILFLPMVEITFSWFPLFSFLVSNIQSLTALDSAMSIWPCWCFSSPFETIMHADESNQTKTWRNNWISRGKKKLSKKKKKKNPRFNLFTDIETRTARITIKPTATTAKSTRLPTKPSIIGEAATSIDL